VTPKRELIDGFFFDLVSKRNEVIYIACDQCKLRSSDKMYYQCFTHFGDRKWTYLLSLAEQRKTRSGVEVNVLLDPTT